jgi:hypothetical protein
VEKEQRIHGEIKIDVVLDISEGVFLIGAFETAARWERMNRQRSR